MIFVTVGIFLDKEFTFQQNVCNACHDVLMMPMNLSDIAFLNIHGLDYCCINSRISKSEVANLLQNVDSNEIFIIAYKHG